MYTFSRRPGGLEDAVGALNMAIEDLTLVSETPRIAPAKAAFTSVSVILTTIKVNFFDLCPEKFLVYLRPGIYDQ